MMALGKLGSLPVLASGCTTIELEEREGLARRLGAIGERHRRKLEERYETVDRWKNKHRKAGDQRQIIIHHKPPKQRFKLDPMPTHRIHRTYEVTATLIDNHHQMHLFRHESLMHRLQLLAHPHYLVGKTIKETTNHHDNKPEKREDTTQGASMQVGTTHIGKISNELQRQILEIQREKREEIKKIQKRQKLLEDIVGCMPQGWKNGEEKQII